MQEYIAKCIIQGENGLKGFITLHEQNNETIIKAEIHNLSEGKHGFHIHEFGDLSNGCITAGGHYNPHSKTHGAPSDENRHVGDLGNIVSQGESVTKFEVKDKLIKLSGVNSVIGRSFVLHKDEDDLGKGGFEDSLTTGHAGARIACGVIGWSQNL